MANLLGLQLGIATRHDNNGVGVFAVQLIDCLAVFVVSGIGDRAGIDYAQVGYLAEQSTLMTTR